MRRFLCVLLIVPALWACGTVSVGDGYAREETAIFAVTADVFNNLGIARVASGDLDDADLMDLQFATIQVDTALDLFWFVAIEYENGEVDLLTLAAAIDSFYTTYKAVEGLVSDTDLLGRDATGALLFTIAASVEFRDLRDQIRLARSEGRQLSIDYVNGEIGQAHESAARLLALIDAEVR